MVLPTIYWLALDTSVLKQSEREISKRSGHSLNTNSIGVGGRYMVNEKLELTLVL